MSYTITNKSLSSMITIFSAKCFYGSGTISSEPLEYLVFYARDISIELDPSQWSFPTNPFQYLITKTSTWDHTLKPLNISYYSSLYIRLVVLDMVHTSLFKI